jgi:hypothetical protein
MEPPHPVPDPKPKGAGPILILGALGFVPFLGVPFGFAALCWGLISDRPRAVRAAVLGATGMVANFAACAGLAWWSAERVTPGLGGFGAIMARAELVQVVQELEQFRRARGHYPERLTELRVGPLQTPAPNIYDKALGIFNRTRPYQYYRDLGDDSYQVFSVGPDGKSGTADDIWPILTDSVLAHSGLRRPE